MSPPAVLHINLSRQKLTLESAGTILFSCPVSSGKAGTGSQQGSGKTPLGRFRICKKIGAGLPEDTIFVSRLPVGRYPAAIPEGMNEHSDFILTRILWLDGLDPENVNTRERYIYIHGTPEEGLIGTPASHGCIRMTNADVADLYDLQAPQLACLPRLGEKSADNIIRSIRGSVEVPFRRVLFGLGIRFVGETTAKYLAEHFRSLDAVMRATREELTEADEVGGRIADAIIEYFADEKNLAIIRRLRAAGLKFEEEARELASESLAGRSFVVSGKFSRSRDEMKELIEMHGGRNLAAVSANVDYIVAGDNMGPAKLRKAEKLGVKIISEEEFIAMVSGQKAPAANGAEADSATTANTGGRNNGAPAATEGGDGEPVQQGELF